MGERTIWILIDGLLELSPCLPNPNQKNTRRGRCFTIDSVDCIIDTTGLPELMRLTPRRHACPGPQYIVSHRFAACWNERQEYVAPDFPLTSGFDLRCS